MLHAGDGVFMMMCRLLVWWPKTFSTFSPHYWTFTQLTSQSETVAEFFLKKCFSLHPLSCKWWITWPTVVHTPSPVCTSEAWNSHSVHRSLAVLPSGLLVSCKCKSYILPLTSAFPVCCCVVKLLTQWQFSESWFLQIQVYSYNNQFKPLNYTQLISILQIMLLLKSIEPPLMI